MSLRIVRNDITNMETQAIVNTANANVCVGAGCDSAVYEKAGFDKLLEYRKNNIGEALEGQAFITPGFNLKAEYIIHTISPVFINGECGEEQKLRECYQNSLSLAKENNISSISIPLISTGSFGYPREAGLRIAVDEINAFLLNNEMEIFLVVFDEESTSLGKKISSDLKSYIDKNYVDNTLKSEYSYGMAFAEMMPQAAFSCAPEKEEGLAGRFLGKARSVLKNGSRASKECQESVIASDEFDYLDDEEHEQVIKYELQERMEHISDTFQQYLFYLVETKGMTGADVYNRAFVDKKVFSKIKNNIDYHPKKITALCLCVGAKLNLDETKDLLARAGYALSPCDKTDIIFSYFIENQVYDMLEIDIQLEEHGLPCLIQ